MMTNYCAHCGRILPENAAFCPACGTPVIEAASNHQEPKEPETFLSVSKPTIGEQRDGSAARPISCAAFLFLLYHFFS